ncbi:MAG: hypothetical protein U5N85_21755 [Arcicella sp.]|nr:hypothetical protein [Arcicella sp.]
MRQILGDSLLEAEMGQCPAWIGIAARNSIEQGKAIKIQDLTDIPLQASGRGAREFKIYDS